MNEYLRESHLGYKQTTYQSRKAFHAGTYKKSDYSLLIKNIFDRITICLAQAVNQTAAACGTGNVLFAGGVSSSGYVRREIGRYIDRNISYEFGAAELSSDNAVGTALLGGARLWQQNP